METFFFLRSGTLFFKYYLDELWAPKVNTEIPTQGERFVARPVTAGPADVGDICWLFRLSALYTIL
jgi:hypothetical protein